MAFWLSRQDIQSALAAPSAVGSAAEDEAEKELMAETSDSAGLLPQQTSAVVCSAGGRSRFSDVAEALYAQQEDKEAEEAGAFSDFAYGFVV